MDSKKRTKYQSRILREMRNNADHPWSPPTSTGSHGTVTLTSEMSFDLNAESALPPMPKINAEALRAKWPEWKNYGKPRDSNHGKENEKPAPTEITNDNSSIFGSESPRLRTRQNMPIVEDTMELEPLPKVSKQGNLTTLLSTLKTARSHAAEAQVEPVKQSSQISEIYLPGRHSDTDSELDERAAMGPPPEENTVHSFFLPNLKHINDFVSGTLRWSSLKNGTPIFVKHGKVHDKETMASLDHHADFEAIAVPQEEEQIFVSLDKIRDEIQTLQQHDDFISQHAEELRLEICHLQDRIVKLECRKDSAVGSESDSSLILQLTNQKSQLEERIASLKAQLEQANRKIGLNDIHNQSFVVERDQALQRASDHVTTIKRLQVRNDAITKERLEVQQALKQTEEDLSSERELLNTLRHKYDMVSKENRLLREDHLSLERHNDDLFNNNRSLQQNNTILQHENTLLQDKVAQLQDQIKELELAQNTQARYAQESQGSTAGLARSKPTGVAQSQDPKARRSVVGGMSAKTTSQMRLPKRDDTLESDSTRESRQFTQESRGSRQYTQESRGSRQYTQESRGSMSVAGKSKITKPTQIRESGDRNTVMSETSAKTTTSHTDLQTQDDYTQQINVTREPRVDPDDYDMTSALFIDDVTLDSSKKLPQKQKGRNASSVRVLSPILSVAEPTSEMEQTTGKQKETTADPELTQSAKRVLNNLCRDHECYNCVLCARIQSNRHETGKYIKKTVRIDRPVPVTDRKKAQPSLSTREYEDQPTLRPSQDPAIALAKVMKGLKDEERHLQFSIYKKQSVYDECDPSVNKKLWKKLDTEIRVLRNRRDLKRDQIYDLHDVLEGQKANAQLMSQEAIDMTITSVLSRDPTWNGIMDF